jgi:hypothetical protein
VSNERKLNVEDRPTSPASGIDVEVALLQLGKRFRNREAESGSFNVVQVGVLREWLED